MARFRSGFAILFGMCLVAGSALAQTSGIVLGDWRVEGAANGRNGDYHPVPWTFAGGGRVFAGDLWSGYWSPSEHGGIFVMIIAQDRVVDHFEVVPAPDGGSFVARKDGADYRYGVRR
jgi:hypothetical protein